MIGQLARTLEVLALIIGAISHGYGLRLGLGLRFRHANAHQVAIGHVLQGVAGGTDLLVDKVSPAHALLVQGGQESRVIPVLMRWMHTVRRGIHTGFQGIDQKSCRSGKGSQGAP